MVKLFELAKIDFGIAHLNHKTRSGESDLDQEFVKRFAEENKKLTEVLKDITDE